MEWCNSLLILLVLITTASCQNSVKVYQVKEETGEDAYIGNIPQDLELQLLSSSDDTPRKYKVLSGGDKIKVDPDSGDLHTAIRLDRERLCPDNPPTCVVDVEVVVLPTEHFEVIKVQLIVEDLNDNTPTFPTEFIKKEISESAIIGSVIRLDSAVDPDLAFNSIQRYEISSSPPGPNDANGISVPYFDLDVIENIDGTKIPQLNLSRKLDREMISSYELLLYAVDGGTPSQTGTATVLISVTDSNDNQPTFAQDSYVITVREDVESGYVVISLEATDLDSGPNAQIEYTFPSVVSEQDRQIFDLNESTGVLSVKGKLDYENKTIHHLTVEARDSGPNPASAYTTVSVKVEDVNDEKPHIDVNFMEFIERQDDDDTSASNEPKPVLIKENTAIGTYLAFVTITDRDTGRNGNVTCRLKELTTFEMKTLDREENRYLIKTKGILDREAKRFHNIEIEAWDSGRPSLSSRRTIVVELFDENDNDPVFGKDLYELPVSENVLPGDEIAVLEADDLDDGINAEITYSAQPKNENSFVPFSINPKTGQVYFMEGATPLDAENKTEPFLLTVTATDNGEPRRKTSTTLSISVADENDNPPHFRENNYVFRIKEDEKIGYYVGRVAADDADVDQDTNGLVTYNFVGDGSPFTIKADTGIIHFNGVEEDLDREMRQSQPYVLKVEAVDHGDKPLKDRATVEIYLIDVNDNPPKIQYPNVTRDVAFLYIRPRLPTAEALKVPDTDPDSEIDDEVLMELAEKDSTANPFPRINVLEIEEPTATAYPIKDVLLIGSSSKVRVSPPDSQPAVITKIRARDPDEGENGRVRFSMAEGNTYNYFAVDMHTGNVTLTVNDEDSLRKMKRGCHVIKVNVNDLGKPTSLSSPAWVNIYVTDENPGTVNVTEAMKSCMNNSFYPILLPPPTDLAAGGLSLKMMIIIGISALVLILLVIIIVVIIKYKCRCCDKKSRTYNCKNAADMYSDTTYAHGSPIVKSGKAGSRQHIPNGTVDSRSSFYSEWTASQMQIAQEKGELVPPEMSDGSVGSRNSGRDSGTGDSMPSDAYHATGAGPGMYRQQQFVNHQSYQRHSQAYNHPHQQPSHVYLPPQDDFIDEESRPMGRHCPPSNGMVFTSKCTNDCRLYGHGDNCWMPDSLQRPPSRMTSFKGTEEYDGDSLKFQKRAMSPTSYNRHNAEGSDYNNMRYTSAPSNASYYDTSGQPRGKFSTFRDDNVGSDTGSPAHSQLASSNVSRQPSASSSYRHGGYPVHGQVSQPSYAQSPIPFNSTLPTTYGQPRGKAYVNLQGGGYDANNGSAPEEVHSNLSSTSSGNQHPAYQIPQSYQQQFYPQEQMQSYPAHYQPSYQGYASGQGVPMHFDDQQHGYSDAAYEENFAATNLLLSPADSEPGDYKQRLERQMNQHQQQPAYNYGNPSEVDSHALLAKEAGNLEHAEDDASLDKLSTIREELDADEVVAEIDGLLL